MEESRWMSLLIMLLILGAIILCGYNAATYNKIANENVELDSISTSGARVMLAFNIIILIILCPLFIWFFLKIAKACPSCVSDGHGGCKYEDRTAIGRFQSGFKSKSADLYNWSSNKMGMTPRYSPQ
jgi:hypothetical protein